MAASKSPKRGAKSQSQDKGEQKHHEKDSGLSGQLLNTGFVGFARGDIRWGDKLDGMSVVGGLRYTFGP